MSTSPPRFVALQRLATGSVVLLGILALGLGGELPGPTAAVVVAALAWRVVRGPTLLSPRAWVALQLSFLIWLALGWGLLGKHVLTVFSQLLLFVQVHRVLTRRGARDDIYSFFIAFGMVLLASVLTFSPLWFLLFLAFLVCFVWAMLLARLALSVEAAWNARHPQGPVPVARWKALDPLVRAPVFAAVAGLNLLLLLGTVGLFFLLPRMQVSFLTGSLLPPVHISGFSDRVRLGEIGLLQLSREPVMRVRAFDAAGRPVPAENLYWHGLALDRFDGRDWTLSDDRKQSLVALNRGKGPPSTAPWALRLEVGMEPLDSRVLFFVPRAAAIYGDFTSLDAASTEGFYLTTRVGVRATSSTAIRACPTRICSGPRTPVPPTPRCCAATPSCPRPCPPGWRRSRTSGPRALRPPWTRPCSCRPASGRSSPTRWTSPPRPTPTRCSRSWTRCRRATASTSPRRWR